MSAPPQIKKCAANPSHIWMADIPFCPYCHKTATARVFYAERERDAEAARRRKQRAASAKKEPANA